MYSNCEANEGNKEYWKGLTGKRFSANYKTPDRCRLRQRVERVHDNSFGARFIKGTADKVYFPRQRRIFPKDVRGNTQRNIGLLNKYFN